MTKRTIVDADYGAALAVDVVGVGVGVDSY
jgi:hypothetical protein